ncbi:hypothetical protein M404DRAFT_998554 [Pisolithus tinctorius Marx 270]|uniref:Uncharacterized protein n=1 Tax=Pisolithus tinctorius Marx 270 TaxID=870435 RepID=A0A0C3JDH9_PISTI|nr:hypothetical protein M404DRAFT_998554 [Pisolithus tinctorius Marx 270]
MKTKQHKLELELIQEFTDNIMACWSKRTNGVGQSAPQSGKTFGVEGYSPTNFTVLSSYPDDFSVFERALTASDHTLA